MNKTLLQRLTLLCLTVLLSAATAWADNVRTINTGALSQYDENAPIGFGASVTGSGDANPVTVTTLSELTAAMTGTDAKTIYVDGTITFTGLVTFNGVKNKTIYGLPGAILQNTTHSANKDESGIMMLKNCDNIIIRNLTFKAAGAYDIDGNDNLTLTASTNIWIDHCDFQDGVDGNLDCNNGSDNICISWCRFRYLIDPWSDGSGGSNDHRFSNLWGGGDGNAAKDEGKLNTTFVNCWWDNGCKQRMPRVRFGKVHLLNCLYSSSSTDICIGAGYRCNIYAENNVFSGTGTPWQNYATSGTYTDYNIKLVGNIGAADDEASSGGIAQFEPSYTYTAMAASDVTDAVSNATNGAGATLTYKLSYPITAKWDFQNLKPSSLENVNIQYTAEGDVNSDVDGIVMHVISSNDGKLAYSASGYAQFNTNTTIQVPVLTTSDVVTVVSYPGQSNYTVGGESAVGYNTFSHTATTDDVSQGYVAIVATATAYIYSIQVVQNEPGISSNPFSITWSMASGATSTAVADPADDIQSKSWTYGSDLTIDATATGTYFGKTFTRFTRVGDSKLDNNRSVLGNSYVEFKFKPYAGLTITPTTLSFDITKIGTGEPNIWVECIQGSTNTSIAENVTIRKNSEETPSEHLTYDLTTKPAITATGNEMAIRIYIGKLANNKQVGIANVVIGGTISGTIQSFTTVYDLAASMMAASSNIEGYSGTLAATTAEAGANAPELTVDATSGKLGKHTDDWAQLNGGTVLTLPGVPQGATVTFALYGSTGLTINNVEYTNGQTYTATKDENLKMTCTTAGYIKSITVEGTPFVTVLDTEGYTNTWQFGKSNGAEEFALQGSAEYTYTVNSYSLTINTDAGKLNNASRSDQWAQCNNGTVFKVPVYAGSKLSWGRYSGGSETGFTIDGQLYNEYYIATEDGTVNMSAKGISYLSYIKIEPATLYEISGTISGGDINGNSILLTANGNGEPYSATVAENAFTLKVPADTYTPELGEDVAYVVSSPATVTVSGAGSIGEVTIVAGSAQTVTGDITNAPDEAFTLTFTATYDANHTATVNCAAGATSYTTSLDPDTYVISSNVGTLSPLSVESFKVVKTATSHNIYFPEAAVPAATSADITVDNTLAAASANNYKTVTDALAAAKAGNISNPVITLTSGQTYREQVIVDQANVTLKTSGEEKATITFYYGIGYSYYSLDANGYYNKDRAMTRNSIKRVNPARWGTTVLVKSTGNGFKAENIVFENSFNQYYTTEEVTDGVTATQVGDATITYNRTLRPDDAGYKAADAKSVTERAAAIAFENGPTGCELYNCEFRGSQDTFYSSGKLYVKKCNIIGNTDYIFGGGYVVFDDCDLTIGGYSDSQNTAYITAYKDGSSLDASKKYVFRDCTVKKTNRQYVAANLGRDWGGAAASVYFFNLKNEIGDKLSYKWSNMGGGVTAGTADLHIYDFNPTVNANYNTTGSNGANINVVLSENDATSIYTGAFTALGFTPQHLDVTLNDNGIYNAVRLAAYNNKTAGVTLADRTLYKDGRWNTICLPFAMDATQIDASVLSGATIKKLSSAVIEGGVATVTFTDADAIDAGTPYIIKWTTTGTDLTNPAFSGVTISSTSAGSAVTDGNLVTFKGTYEPFTLTANNKTQLYLKSNQLYYPTAAINVGAFRGYFELSEEVNAQSFVLDFGDATGIDDVRSKMADASGNIFDLQGRKVAQPTKGLYIVNGRKVVIK